MREKINIDELKTLDPNPVCNLIYETTIKIREDQERALMSTIQYIGGATYQEITIDKNKVVEAFKKCFTAVKPIYIPMRDINQLTPYDFECPTCNGYLSPIIHSPHCPNCGQKLDWEKAEENKK